MKALIFCILISQIGFSQPHYLKVVISGTLPSNPTKLYLENVGYGIIDSSFCKSNTIFMLKKYQYPCFRFIYGQEKSKIFFLLDDIINLHINIESYLPDEPHVIEGHQNQIYQNFKDTLFMLHLLKSRATNQNEENLIDSTFFKSFESLMNNYPFLGMMSLYDKKELIRYMNPPPRILNKYYTLINGLDIKYKNHPVYEEIVLGLDSLKRLTPGGTIYDFNLINTKKEYIYTFDKRGKFLLLLFSSRNCLYVQEIEKKLIESYKELNSLNFEVLRVSVDFSLFNFDTKLLDNINGIYDYYPWESVYLFNDSIGNKIMRTYNIVNWPHTFLYSPDGILLETNPTIETVFNLLKMGRK